MKPPTLDECLEAFAVARHDLKQAEHLASRQFADLEETHRTVREKRALVARLRAEVAALLPDDKEGAA